MTRKVRIRNTSSDLNNILFEQLDRLQDEDLDLDKELERADGIGKIANNIVENGKLQLDTAKLVAEYSGSPEINSRFLLGDNNDH